ncbi:hypothetical protein LZ31DRAFT_147940 [Colletotrichum somersetense]|nr:hypothetical protein LZ31DRAFT_147940 [Colletotrichum somersetense]
MSYAIGTQGHNNVSAAFNFALGAVRRSDGHLTVGAAAASSSPVTERISASERLMLSCHKNNRCDGFERPEGAELVRSQFSTTAGGSKVNTVAMSSDEPDRDSDSGHVRTSEQWRGHGWHVVWVTVMARRDENFFALPWNGFSGNKAPVPIENGEIHNCKMREGRLESDRIYDHGHER